MMLNMRNISALFSNDFVNISTTRSSANVSFGCKKYLS
uniref:Uncharacterized protein n=1 Tax=Arundo donax TaxID=35708 RepID=A0A0A9CKA0_ARUDO